MKPLNEGHSRPTSIMQTYIEPAFDVWTREDKKWNIFTTDPKGGAPRSIVKSYRIAVARELMSCWMNFIHSNIRLAALG